MQKSHKTGITSESDGEEGHEEEAEEVRDTDESVDRGGGTSITEVYMYCVKNVRCFV